MQGVFGQKQLFSFLLRLYQLQPLGQFFLKYGHLQVKPSQKYCLIPQDYVLQGVMVATSTSIEYTSDQFYSQHLGCCVNLCPCIGCQCILTCVAVHNQPHQQIHMQLPSLWPAKPRIKSQLHPKDQPGSSAILPCQTHVFYTIPITSKRP